MIFGAYLGNRYIGAVDQTWITYVMLYSTTWASTMATGFNDNFWSTYLGIKPNSNPVNKIGFAIAHALVTYPTLILITLLAPVANKSFNAVVDPIIEAASDAAKKVLPRFRSEAAEYRKDCATVLEN